MPGDYNHNIMLDACVFQYAYIHIMHLYFNMCVLTTLWMKAVQSLFVGSGWLTTCFNYNTCQIKQQFDCLVLYTSPHRKT